MPFSDASGSAAAQDRSVGMYERLLLAIVYQLAEPLEIRAGGETLAKWPRGWVIIVQPGGLPEAADLELVVAKHDRDPEGQAYIMRYRRGPEGEDMLYPITGATRGVTTEQGWEIVATVLDEPRRPKKWEDPSGLVD